MGEALIVIIVVLFLFFSYIASQADEEDYRNKRQKKTYIAAKAGTRIKQPGENEHFVGSIFTWIIIIVFTVLFIASIL